MTLFNKFTRRSKSDTPWIISQEFIRVPLSNFGIPNYYCFAKFEVLNINSVEILVLVEGFWIFYRRCYWLCFLELIEQFWVWLGCKRQRFGGTVIVVVMLFLLYQPLCQPAEPKPPSTPNTLLDHFPHKHLSMVVKQPRACKTINVNMPTTENSGLSTGLHRVTGSSK